MTRFIVKAKVSGSDERLDIKDGVWTTKYRGNKSTSLKSIERGLNYIIFASGFSIKLLRVISFKEDECM